MLPRHHQPIVAIATAPGRGAVGIVRVSGRSLAAFTEALLGRSLTPRQATYLPFRDATGDAIDHGLALWFPGPQSYTGEDVLELQAHGGNVVLQLLLARCLEVGRAIRRGRDPGDDAGVDSDTAHTSDTQHTRPLLPDLRLAEPGEFTERAFLNDKLDLAQAEAVADLIDASTEAAARSAARSLSGVFSARVDGLRERVVRLRMLVEATLDFPEEEIEFLERADARGQLDAIDSTLGDITRGAKRGALLQAGMQVVLAGQPNVGKSSLLNALAGAELAIVTPVPGTTRDRIGQTIQIEGVPLHIVDTAGLRDDAEAVDEVERIGIARSWSAVADADAVVFLHDLTRSHEAAYAAGERRIAERFAQHFGERAARVLHVYNKADLAHAHARVPDDGLAISALTGAGLPALRDALLAVAGWDTTAEGVFIARARHLQALARTQAHLNAARALLVQGDTALDLFAEELRLAHDALAEITGRFTADDLLGEIFGRFCIGK